MNINKGIIYTVLIAAITAVTTLGSSVQAQFQYPNQRGQNLGSATRQAVPQTPNYQTVTLTEAQMAKSTLGASFADSAVGVVVRSVYTNSPADKAGLKTGYVISKLNGKAVSNSASLNATIEGMSDGDLLKLTCKNSVGKVADVQCNVSTLGQVMEASNVPEAGVYGSAIAQAKVSLEQMGIRIKNATQELEAMKKQYAAQEKKIGELEAKADEIRKKEAAKKADAN
jgi:C-terminal processing protease CtpA/Prc